MAHYLHLCELFAPVVGGTERHVQDLSRVQAAAGHDVTVMTFAHPDLPRVEMLDGVRIERVDGWNRLLRRFAEQPERLYHPTAPDPGLVAVLRKRLRSERPDVVHAHGWMGLSVGLVTRPLGIPFVWSLHDYGAVCVKRTFEHPLAHRCPGPAPQRCLPCSIDHYGAVRGPILATTLAASRPLFRRADRLVANSPEVAATLGTLRLAPGALRVISPYVAPRVGDPRPRPEAVPTEGPYLLFVGALTEHKGVPVLLEAYRALTELHSSRGDTVWPLVLLGTRATDLARNLPAGVTVHTEVPHDDVLAAWQHASVGLVPSVWPEAFGLVAAEAMAAGVPVVASRTGALARMVVDEANGLLVEPGDAGELAAAIDRLAGEPHLCRRLGDQGRVTARALDSTTAFEELYAELLNPGPPS
jgi:glycosyltransferase involved in cell wall biosynthesis